MSPRPLRRLASFALVPLSALPLVVVAPHFAPTFERGLGHVGAGPPAPEGRKEAPASREQPRPRRARRHVARRAHPRHGTHLHHHHRSHRPPARLQDVLPTDSMTRERRR